MQNEKKQTTLVMKSWNGFCRAETIALAGHTNPDGDAIGACLALGGALEKAGKQVQVILEKYADKYQLIPNGRLGLPRRKEIARLPELFLVLDCGDEGPLGGCGGNFPKSSEENRSRPPRKQHLILQS